MHTKSLQSCLTLCNSVYSPPASSVHGILQARILEWAAMVSSRGSFRTRDWTRISYVSCIVRFSSVQLFSSVWLFVNPMDCTTPGFLVHQQLPELAQHHVDQLTDAIQPSHPLSSPSPPAFNLSQHQGLFQWVGFSHQVAKVLELQVQHQSFQWIFSNYFL